MILLIRLCNVIANLHLKHHRVSTVCWSQFMDAELLYQNVFQPSIELPQYIAVIQASFLLGGFIFCYNMMESGSTQPEKSKGVGALNHKRRGRLRELLYLISLLLLIFTMASLQLSCSSNEDRDYDDIFQAIAPENPQAVGVEHLDAVKDFVRKDPSLVRSRNDKGFTALHLASREGFGNTAEFLIASGADVNARDVNGDSPLHHAKTREIAGLLVSKRADVKAGDNMGMTPLHSARTGEIAELLISSGADVKARDNEGCTPLHRAAATPFKEYGVVTILIDKGAELNARNKMGETPLFIAASIGHKEMVELLISKGADVNVKDKAGRTPVQIARLHKYEWVVEPLKRHGAR